MKKITKILIAIIFITAPFVSKAMPSAVSTFPIIQSEVTETKATLRGRAIPCGTLPCPGNTKGYFRYSTASIKPVFCNDTYSSDMVGTSDINLGSGSSLVNFSKDLKGLEPGTTYYYCAYASDKSGIFPSPSSSPSPVQSFTTKGPTQATTLPASDITKTSAVLNGKYTTQATATTWFEYSVFGNTTGTPSQTAHQTPSGPGEFNATLTGLTPNTNYSFKAVAKNPSEAKVYGQSLSFYTKGDDTVNYFPVDNGTGYIPNEYNPNTYTPDTYTPDGYYPNGYTPTPNEYTPDIYTPYIFTPNVFTPTWPLNPTTLPPGTLIKITTPTGPASILIDDVVRNGEGVEHVFQRQIEGLPALAKIYGYQNTMNLKVFSWDLAHSFAQLFGYVNNMGKEVRVSYPNIAAYELRPQRDGSTIVNEYLFGNLIATQRIKPFLITPPHYYEYYFQHR